MMEWDYIQYDKYFMLSFFYTLSLLFILVEWIQFRKKAIVYSKNFLTVNKFQLTFFFISKLLNVISIPIGLFTPLYKYYLTLLIIEAGKFGILWTKNSFIINLYSLISVFIYILIYLVIFIQGVLL
jgi:hypothetical protein